jgi:hypothetical protein
MRQFSSHKQLTVQAVAGTYVVVLGDKRVADIYLGEFMRLWKHHSFRESRTFNKNKAQDASLLRTDNWWKKYFEANDNSARRAYFSKAL